MKAEAWSLRRPWPMAERQNAARWVLDSGMAGASPPVTGVPRVMSPSAFVPVMLTNVGDSAARAPEPSATTQRPSSSRWGTAAAPAARARAYDGRAQRCLAARGAGLRRALSRSMPCAWPCIPWMTMFSLLEKRRLASRPVSASGDIAARSSMAMRISSSQMRLGTEAALARVVGVFCTDHLNHAYLFANKRANRMKVLVHDGIGVWLAARRLNAGKFAWPANASSTLQLTRPQLCVGAGPALAAAGRCRNHPRALKTIGNCRMCRCAQCCRAAP